MNSAIWNVDKEPAVFEQGQKCYENLWNSSDYYHHLEAMLEDLNLEQIEDMRLPPLKNHYLKINRDML